MNEWSNISIIASAGDIDIATVPVLRARVDALISQGSRRILVNCKDVGFIDSTGLAFLLTCARRLMQRGGLLSVVNANDQILRFLQISRLVDVLHASGTVKPKVPVLAPNAAPLWSKSVSIESGIEHLGFYRHWVVQMLESLSMDRDARFDTALAAGEALGNYYDHACGDGCVMTVRAYADRVVIEVVDNGLGFSIADDEEPTSTEERGRGIKLMRMLVDGVEIRRRSDVRGTYVRLVKLY